jgi:hypothetical protein
MILMRKKNAEFGAEIHNVSDNQKAVWEKAGYEVYIPEVKKSLMDLISTLVPKISIDSLEPETKKKLKSASFTDYR